MRYRLPSNHVQAKRTMVEIYLVLKAMHPTQKEHLGFDLKVGLAARPPSLYCPWGVRKDVLIALEHCLRQIPERDMILIQAIHKFRECVVIHL